MQLSAPTLPIDPGVSLSADASGFPATGGKGDANASATSDFGAMLSAESRGNSRSSSAARSNPRAATKEANRPVEDHPSTREFSSGGRSTSSVDQGRARATSTTTPEALAAAAGLIVPTQPTVATQESPVVEIDLTLNLQSPAVSSEQANTSADVISSDEGSVASARTVAGRAFSGEMPAGKSRASLHAYGLRGKTPAGSPGSTDPAPAAPAHGSAAANPFVISSAGLEASREPRSTPSASSAAPSTKASVAETGTLGAPSAVMLSNQAVASLTTDAGRVEQVGGTNGEVTAAAPADERAVADDLIKPEALPSLAANIPEVGSADDAEIIEPVATAAVAEKIAAQLSRFTDRVAGSNNSTQRLSLDAGSKDVAPHHDGLGINVAKLDALMPALASTPTPAPVAIEHASFAAAPLSFDNLVKDGGEGTAGQMAQVARRAVESALAVADQYVTGDQRSVKLQFTVGGEQLAVRVELKGNQVHTTFRTDSPELRSALAQEWQTVSAAQTGVRTQRLADPVFASNSSTGQGMSSDSGAAHQRDSGARHPQTAPHEILGLRNAFPTTAAAPAVAMAAPVTAAREPSSTRLRTFA